MVIIVYQGRSKIIDSSTGIKLAKLLSATTKTSNAVAPPNHPIAEEAVKKTIELRSGNNAVDIKVASIGSGLSCKFSTLENGSENIYTYHIIVNHNAANAGIMASRTVFSLLGVKSVYRNLTNPTTTAVELISIPVINAK